MSLISATEMSTTRVPVNGMLTQSPSSTSWRIASRSGPRLAPSQSATADSTTCDLGSISPVRIARGSNAAIAYADLLHQARLIASLNFNPSEAYTVVALAFFVILYPIVRATYTLERRMAKGD